MIAAGSADLNVEARGETPLLLAARAGSCAVVAELIDAGADVNHVFANGETLLAQLIQGCLALADGPHVYRGIPVAVVEVLTARGAKIKAGCHVDVLVVDGVVREGRKTDLQSVLISKEAPDGVVYPRTKGDRWRPSVDDVLTLSERAADAAAAAKKAAEEAEAAKEAAAAKKAAEEAEDLAERLRARRAEADRNMAELLAEEDAAKRAAASSRPSCKAASKAVARTTEAQVHEEEVEEAAEARADRARARAARARAIEDALAGLGVVKGGSSAPQHPSMTSEKERRAALVAYLQESKARAQGLLRRAMDDPVDARALPTTYVPPAYCNGLDAYIPERLLD